MKLFLNSVRGRGLKHATRGSHLAGDSILLGPRCVFRIFK